MAASRPLTCHPTARALFDALDATNEEDNCNQKKQPPRQSNFIRKQSQTLGWRNRHSQASRYPIAFRNSQDDSPKISFSVQQVQRGEVEGNYGTGATVWPASLVLIHYLAQHADTLLKDKRVIDLGAGTGITSLVAAFLGASHVVCTDNSEAVIALAKSNVDDVFRDQHLHCGVDVKEYSWGDGSQLETFHVILGSDCVLPKLYPLEPLVNAISELLAPEAVAILSYEHRYYPKYNAKEKFCELCRMKGLEVQVIPSNQHDEIYSTEDIEIWHVQRVLPDSSS